MHWYADDLAFSALPRLPKGVLPVVIAGVLTAAMASAAHGADRVAGKKLALQWCAACHIVSEDQARASSVSLPSFYDMAKDPEWSEAALATFLADPHPNMPDMNLGTIETANLAAYIRSLAPD